MCYIMFFRMSSEQWLTSEEVPFDSTAEEALYTPLPPQADSPEGEVISISSGSASGSGGSNSASSPASVEELLKESPPEVDILMEVVQVKKKRKLDFTDCSEEVPLATQHGVHNSTLEYSINRARSALDSVDGDGPLESFLVGNIGIEVRA